MKSGTTNPEDELRQLLREAGSAPQAEKPRRTRGSATMSEPADLQALIRDGGSGSLTQRRVVYSGEAAPAASIQELLRASAAPVAKKPETPRSSGESKASALPALDQVLHEVQGRRPSAEPSPKTVATRQALASGLGEALSETHLMPDAAKTDKGNARSFAPSWLARASGVVALLLAICLVSWWPARQADGPAGTLQGLAGAVEHEYKTSGHLPEQLSGLDAFPKGAVEWPAKFWNARDAAGRTEVIWIPNGPRHYRIVLRHGADVWFYQDKEGKARLLNTGRP